MQHREGSGKRREECQNQNMQTTYRQAPQESTHLWRTTHLPVRHPKWKAEERNEGRKMQEKDVNGITGKKAGEHGEEKMQETRRRTGDQGPGLAQLSSFRIPVTTTAAATTTAMAGEAWHSRSPADSAKTPHLPLRTLHPATSCMRARLRSHTHLCPSWHQSSWQPGAQHCWRQQVGPPDSALPAGSPGELGRISSAAGRRSSPRAWARERKTEAGETRQHLQLSPSRDHFLGL